MDLEDVNMSQRKVFGVSIIALVGIFVLLSIVVYLAKNRVELSRRPISVDTPDTAQPSPRESTLNGTMGLSLKGANGAYKKGDTVSVMVYADAKDSKITGYDADLRYDSEHLQFAGIVSEIPDMDVYHSLSDADAQQSSVYITGVKKTTRKDPFVFQNTALVEVRFTVLASGATQATLFYEPGGTTDSNLNTSANMDVLSSVEGTDITVR